MKLIGIALLLLLLTQFPIGEKEEFSYPDYFPEPYFDFDKTPLDSSVIALGRLLFFDPILSKDSTISCASCHSPYNGFTHTDHALSHGISDSIGKRNAPALFNLSWQPLFMWDGAIHSLLLQPLAPLLNKGEMGESLSRILEKLNKSAFYRKKFHHSLSTDTIASTHLLTALLQFQLNIVSFDSKYDAFRQGKATFSKQERAGYALFREHCNECHTEPLFSGFNFAYNGLSLDSSLKDLGRMAITGASKDSLAFKIPSLRNLRYTKPYMHDGRFETLREVLNHYKYQFKSTPEKTSYKGLELTSTEEVDLTTFLLTLNDQSFVFNKKYNFPRELLKKGGKLP